MSNIAIIVLSKYRLKTSLISAEIIISATLCENLALVIEVYLL